MRKNIALCALLLCLLTGCTAQPPDEPGAVQTQETVFTYALVVKSLENPYMTTMYSGFQQACLELGAVPHLLGPAADGEPSQPDILAALMEEEIDAIAIAANDMDEVSPMLREALARDIPVISLDSMAKPDERRVHIQQASPEMIGRVLIQACVQMLDGEGEFAILTTTDAMPNQASWVQWMLRELSDNPDAYAGMTLVEIAYGLDEHNASAEAVRALLAAYPDLGVIIAPTSVGMQAAAEEIKKAGAPVKLTGLGLPSVMEPYIMEGICPWMYLWNPSEVGYLAAWAMDALVEGALRGEPDEILTAGTLGDKVVTQSEDGGTEIVLGNPMVFDATNIAVWGELF